MRALKIVCLCVCFNLCVGALVLVQAQSLGDYRSVATGNWSSLSTWQYYNGSAWVASTTYPGQIAAINNVTLQSPFIVTVDVDPNFNGFQMVNVFINNGATLTDTASGLYYSVAPSNLFTINGTVSLVNSTDTSSGVYGGTFTIAVTGSLSAHTVYLRFLNNFGTATITSNAINIFPINTTTNDGIWVNQVNSVLNFGGTSMSAGLSASATGNTVNYNSAVNIQSIRSPITSYFNLTLSGNGARAKTLTANTVVLGTVAIQGDSRFLLSTFNLSIRGDWNNSSTNASALAFGSVTPLITLNGTSQQNIINTGHSSGTFFNNLRIFNTSTSSPQVRINNTTGSSVLVRFGLTMTSGNVDIGGTIFQLGGDYTSATTLTHSGLASAGWFYNGSFSRSLITSAAIPNGSNNGFFPIGTSTDFRPFYASTVTPPSSSSRIIVSISGSTSFVDVSLVDGASTIARQNRSGWSVSTFGNGTYNIQAGGTGLGVIGSTTDLRLTPGTFVLGTAGTNTGTTSNPLVERTGLTMANLNNNTFYVGSVDLTSSPLPVELISFSGETEGSVVNLNWITRTELNCDYFTVYRSVNGIDFVPVGTRNGAGTTKIMSQYALQDTSPLQGTNYYRLEQTDWDGTKTILSMISVEANGSEAIQVYPNPVAEGQSVDLKLQGLASHASQSIYVFDYLGRQVLNSIIAVDESGSFNGRLKLPHLSAGCYFIKINSNTKRLVIR